MIAIKNMKMPNRCGNCLIVQRTKSGYRCPILSRQDGFSHTTSLGHYDRMEGCPLIELYEKKTAADVAFDLLGIH